MARLNIVRSRVRTSICSLVRIDQTCFGRSDGFWPMTLPLFQGSRRGVENILCAWHRGWRGHPLLASVSSIRTGG